MNITIQRKDLLAVSYAMAVKDIRYYMNGIRIEAGNELARLIATDGHRIHAVQFNAPEQAELFTAIMPASFVNTLLKYKFGKYATKTFNLEFTELHVKCSMADSIAFAVLIDGKFPDYQRCIPATTSGEVAMYNPEYLMDLTLAGRAYNESKNEVYTPRHNGQSSGLFTSGCFLAIIMPLRGNDGSIPDAMWQSPITGAQIEVAA